MSALCAGDSPGSSRPSKDVNRSEGSDDITVTTFVSPTPLAVTLE